MMLSHRSQAVEMDWPWFAGPHGDFTHQQPEGLSQQPQRNTCGLFGRAKTQLVQPAFLDAKCHQEARQPRLFIMIGFIYGTLHQIYHGESTLVPQTRKVPREFGAWSFIYRVMDNAIVADQRIICIDAETGKNHLGNAFSR